MEDGKPAAHRQRILRPCRVMHDEAAAHYTDMIDQMTLGHVFLEQQFNVTPKTSWQIDPFGHSSTHASLIMARAGLDAVRPVQYFAPDSVVSVVRCKDRLPG